MKKIQLILLISFLVASSTMFSEPLTRSASLSSNKNLDLEYIKLLAEIDNLDNYNHELQSKLATQDVDVQSLRQQVLSVSDIKENIGPLMVQMHSSLEKFIAADLPFLSKQRKQSLHELSTDLNKTSLPLSQKFQKIFQAYNREAEYGEKMKTYQGELSRNGRQVNFLSLGRAALYYQTLDKKLAAKWSVASSKWIVLDENANEKISKAIRVASGVSIGKLLDFPMLGLK